MQDVQTGNGGFVYTRELSKFSAEIMTNSYSEGNQEEIGKRLEAGCKRTDAVGLC